MSNSVFAAETLNSFSGFLKWGPTGLAGLMLVLVIVALSVGKLSASRERVLTKFMYIGAVCFALALGASFIPQPGPGGAYALHLRVLPLDMGAKQYLPMPIINVNNKILNANPPRTYSIMAESTAVIDVSDAINFVQDLRSQDTRQRHAMSTAVSTADALVAKLQDSTQLIGRACSGGSNGIPPQSAPTLIGINTSVANSIASTKAALASALAEISPQIKN
jgi:hypothetical protein